MIIQDMDTHKLNRRHLEMIKETETRIDKYHKYRIPFEEFWEVISKSKIIDKYISYTKMFSNDSPFVIYLDRTKIENYVKALSLTGELQSIFIVKGDIVEITTLETEKND